MPRIRIVEQEFVPDFRVADASEHPKNPRRGDDAAVRESAETNGFFGAILVQKSTGYVIGGNTRYRVMRDDNRPSMPVFVVDCTDEEAERIMLADNRTSDLAFYDDPTLKALLSELHDTDTGLVGTGYDDAAYALLLGDTGVQQGPTPSDRQAGYDESDVRSIILPFATEDYIELMGMFTRMREALAVDTNAEVVAALLREACAA